MEGLMGRDGLGRLDNIETVLETYKDYRSGAVNSSEYY
jgi:hypothetical protein